MTSSENNMVPTCILNASLNVRRSFWEGLCRAYGLVKDQNMVKENDLVAIDQTSMTSAATVYALASSLGYQVRVDTLQNQEETVFRVMCTLNRGSEDPIAIKKMHKIDYTGYVYDLTTENHHFAAGIGELIVHNTDSIFVIFPDSIMETTLDISHDQLMELKKMGAQKGKAKLVPSIKTAIKASKEFKKYIKPPHDAEYEKTFWPFILLSKKRYVGNLYEMDDKKFKQKSMGIVLKRRDNAPIVKRVYGGALDIMLNKQEIEGSIAWVEEQLEELIRGKCGLEELIVSKSIRADYADPDRIAHKVLAERMGQRDPGNKPQVNDRIPYIYITTPGKEKPKLQGDRIEAPSFVIANKLQPDYAHYITNQIMSPMCQLYAIVIHMVKQWKRPQHHWDDMYAKLLKEYEGDEKKAKEKLMANKEKEVKQLLFDPILVKLENMRSGNQEITRWFPIIKRQKVL